MCPLPTQKTQKLKAGGCKCLIYAPASGSHQHFVSPLTTFSQLTALFWPGPVHCRGLGSSPEGAIWPLCWIYPPHSCNVGHTGFRRKRNQLLDTKSEDVEAIWFPHIETGAPGQQYAAQHVGPDNSPFSSSSYGSIETHLHP